MPTHDASAGARNVWHLTGTVGAVTLDTYFIVPTSYQWAEHVDAQKLQDPCTGAYTLMVTSDGTVGKLFGSPAMFCLGSAAQDAVADLRAAWQLRGPWTLTTPTETLSVLADPSAGNFTEQNNGNAWVVQVPWQEV